RDAASVRGALPPLRRPGGGADRRARPEARRLARRPRAVLERDGGDHDHAPPPRAPGPRALARAQRPPGARAPRARRKRARGAPRAGRPPGRAPAERALAARAAGGPRARAREREPRLGASARAAPGLEGAPLAA